jgi:hypothetical protein
MPYRLAGIDVHKKMLAVVVADVEVDGDFHFDRHKVGTSPADLRGLADWLVEHEGRGSRHGIDRAVLATGVGNPRTTRRAPSRAQRCGRQAGVCGIRREVFREGVRTRKRRA